MLLLWYTYYLYHVGMTSQSGSEKKKKEVIFTETIHGACAEILKGVLGM